MIRYSPSYRGSIAVAFACLAAASASASDSLHAVDLRAAFDPPGAAEPDAPHELSVDASRALGEVLVARGGFAFERDESDARFSAPRLTLAASRSLTLASVDLELAVEHAWLTAIDSETARQWSAGATLQRGVWRAGAELGAATGRSSQLVERHAELSIGIDVVRDLELSVAWRTGDDRGAVFGLRIVFARAPAPFQAVSALAPYHR